MFAKLALRNVRRQIRNYLIYFVTVALSIALMFAVNNLSYSRRIQTLSQMSTEIRSMFTIVTVLSCLVTALVLSYATGFMLKLRKKEFGMYLTLGMTRRNIQALFVCETGLLSGLALMAGMGAGLVIFQLLAALFASILEIPFCDFRLFRPRGLSDHRRQHGNVPAVHPDILAVSEKGHRFPAFKRNGRGEK